RQLRSDARQREVQRDQQDERRPAVPSVEPAVESLHVAALDLGQRIEHPTREGVVALLERRDRHVKSCRLPGSTPIVRPTTPAARWPVRPAAEIAARTTTAPDEERSKPALDPGVGRMVVDRFEVLRFDAKAFEAPVADKSRRDPAHEVLDEAR